MIGKLTGCIEVLGEDNLILDVHGVGYVIVLSHRGLSTLTVGDLVSFFIDTQIKDDKIVLFGFLTPQEQEWFRLLQTTQGVGAKFALSLLSYFTPERLYDVILKEARTELVQADGVGPKLAARLITELKDPLLKRPHLRGPAPSTQLSPPDPTVLGNTSLPFASDLLSALVNLGYKKTEAVWAMEKVHDQYLEPSSFENVLKGCLAHLSPR